MGFNICSCGGAYGGGGRANMMLLRRTGRLGSDLNFVQSLYWFLRYNSYGLVF